MNRVEILITGSAGQGALWLGKQVANRVINIDEHKKVSFLAEYESGVRSGHSRAQVVVSNDKINTPFISEPDIEIKLEDGKLKCGTLNIELESKGRLNEKALEEIFNRNKCRKLLGI